MLIEAKFAEISGSDAKALGFDWFLGNSIGAVSKPLLTTNASRVALVSTQFSNETPVSVTGIFSPAQMAVLVRALEQRHSVDLLSTPSVTTLSGHQAQISSLDLMTVVTGVNSIRDPDGTVRSNLKTEPLPCGPVLDVVPDVSADGYSIRLTINCSINEFVGYETPDKRLQKASDANNRGLSVQVPLPKIRTRQMSTSANVWDGQDHRARRNNHGEDR